MAGVGRAEGAEAMGREDGLEGNRYRACIQSVRRRSTLREEM